MKLDTSIGQKSRESGKRREQMEWEKRTKIPQVRSYSTAANNLCF